MTLALQEMHFHKILHRDLKPNNILYHPYQGIIKVIDLGLGKCLRVEERKNFFTTRPRSSLGTPNFMPIEQWLDFKNLDERADIYSLGATAYFLLTGRYPYKNNQNLLDIYTQLVQQNLIPLEQLCGSSVPKELISLVKKMMAYRAEDRYTHTQQLIPILESLLQKSP